MVEHSDQKFPMIELATHPDTLDAFLRWPMASSLTGLVILETQDEWKQLLTHVCLPRMLEVAAGLIYPPNISLYYRRTHPLYGTPASMDHFVCEVWLFDTPSPSRLEQQPLVPSQQLSYCLLHTNPEPTLWVELPTNLDVSSTLFPLRVYGAFFNEQAFYQNPDLNRTWAAYVQEDLLFLENLLVRLGERWTRYTWEVGQKALAHHSCPPKGGDWLSMPILGEERRVFFQVCYDYLQSIRGRLRCKPEAFERVMCLLQNKEKVC